MGILMIVKPPFLYLKRRGCKSNDELCVRDGAGSPKMSLSEVINVKDGMSGEIRKSNILCA